MLGGTAEQRQSPLYSYSFLHDQGVQLDSYLQAVWSVDGSHLCMQGVSIKEGGLAACIAQF